MVRNIGNLNHAGKGERKSPVQSISRAASILRCLANDIHSVKEIAAQCELSMATVHRILKALEEEDFVFRDPVERKYYLGLFASQLSLNQSNAHKWLIAQCFDEVNRIWQLFNEFTALDIEVGFQALNLLTVQSKMNYSVSRPPQSFLGSESIVFLAQHNDADLEMILNNINPKSMDGDILVDKETVKKQVKQARRQGYFISTGFTQGIMGISVPVNHYLCPVALTVVGPEIRLKPVVSKVITELLQSTVSLSDKISQSLPGL